MSSGQTTIQQTTDRSFYNNCQSSMDCVGTNYVEFKHGN